MSKIKIAKLIKSTQRVLSKRSPDILVGLGIAGMFTTVVLAVKATPKALEIIEEEKEQRDVEELSKTDAVKACWKVYVPAAVTGVAATACILGGHSVSTRRTAAIATAYKVTEAALSDYRESVIETVGEEREKTIREKAHQKRIDREPVYTDYPEPVGNGKELCIDAWSGREFMSDENAIRRAVNEVNNVLNNDDYASLNDYFDRLGLDYSDEGTFLGWDRQRDGLLSVTFTSCISRGRLCRVVELNKRPRENYSSYC